MLLSGVRSSCDMLARNSDLYFEVSASSFGLLFQRAARLLDFLVLAFHFDVLFGELLRLLRQLFVGLLQFFLLRLQFGGQLLRLLQQAFGLHRGFNTVEHDADAGGQLFQERQVRGGESRSSEASSITAFTRSSNSTGSTITFRGTASNKPERIGTVFCRQVGDQHAPLLGRALADQALADLQPAADGRPCRRRQKPRAATDAA